MLRRSAGSLIARSLNPGPDANRVALTIFAMYQTYLIVASGKKGALIKVDHFQPRSKGGTDRLENLMTACLICNQMKSGQTFESVEAARQAFQGYYRKMKAYWKSMSNSWLRPPPNPPCHLKNEPPLPDSSHFGESRERTFDPACTPV